MKKSTKIKLRLCFFHALIIGCMIYEKLTAPEFTLGAVIGVGILFALGGFATYLTGVGVGLQRGREEVDKEWGEAYMKELVDRTEQVTDSLQGLLQRAQKLLDREPKNNTLH